MRLSELLSKQNYDTDFTQIDGFLNQKLSVGKHRKLIVGQIRLSFYCLECDGISIFRSSEEIYCIGAGERQISIDCILECGCGSSVAVWFLVESYTDITGQTIDVRVLKRRERLSDKVRLVRGEYTDYADLLDKAERAHRDGLGAGSIVYLRKIFEMITVQAAAVAGIDTNTPKGKRKTFKDLLIEVDAELQIIPRQFSENKYKLFSEISDVLHGNYDEQAGLKKFEPFYRLIRGIIDNIRHNEEILSAINSLGWNAEGGGDGSVGT